ncbi:MAG: pyridoxal-phosphate dependent enzyme [bacterium]|nr:pyridoxal-phosphate dependent enzyme [bacterium]
MNREPDIQEIRRTAERLRPHIHRTPVLTCSWLDGLCGAELHFKCENFQKAGAFKIRGALNAVLSLTDDEAARGVVTHSSGNFGAALALAARIRGIRATVVMPSNSTRIKVDAVTGYGAQVELCEPTLQAREAGAERVLVETGGTLLHPYDDYRIIAGQGTAALELCLDCPDLDIVIAPVGGGGLLGGTAIATRALLPAARVLAGEPAAADDAYRSLQAGELIPQTGTMTIADGLRTSLGARNFPIIHRLVDRIILMSESAIVEAMRLIWERMKIVVEPSAAVTLAAILTEPELFAGRRVGLIISGGNVDLAALPFTDRDEGRAR